MSDEFWKNMADVMQKDNESRRKKDEDLTNFIKDNPGGLWDSLVKE